MFSVGVKEKINEPETIDADITGIERLNLLGDDKHSSLNKVNKTQGSGKAVSIWWVILDIQSTVKFIMNNELVKETRDTRGKFVRVQCNSGTKIISTEANLPWFLTVWFDNICITNILPLSKAKK